MEFDTVEFIFINDETQEVERFLQVIMILILLVELSGGVKDL